MIPLGYRGVIGDLFMLQTKSLSFYQEQGWETTLDDANTYLRVAVNTTPEQYRIEFKSRIWREDGGYGWEWVLRS